MNEQYTYGFLDNFVYEVETKMWFEIKHIHNKDAMAFSILNNMQRKNSGLEILNEDFLKKVSDRIRKAFLEKYSELSI